MTKIKKLLAFSGITSTKLSQSLSSQNQIVSSKLSDFVCIFCMYICVTPPPPRKPFCLGLLTNSNPEISNKIP